MSETNRKKSGCGCLTFLGAAVLVVAGGAYFYFRVFSAKELTPLEGAKVVPQEALIAAFISTDSKSWSKLEKFGTPETQQLLGESIENWQAEISGDTEINYQTDLKPWLGNIMLAFFPSDKSVPAKEKYDMLMVAGIKNKLKALHFADRLKNQLTNQEGQQIQQRQYRGITIAEAKTEKSGVLSVAILGNQLVLASERKTIELAIDTFKGEPSFASKQGAKEIFSQKLNIQNPIAQIYLADLAGVIQQAALSTPQGSEIPTEALQDLEQVKSVAIGVGVEEREVRFQAIAKLNPESIERGFKPVKGKVLSEFPADTIGLISGQGIGNIWSQFVAQSGKDPDLQVLVGRVRQFFQSMNLDVDKEVFGWLDGEFALGVIALEQGSFSDLGLGGTIILETSDRQTGQRSLEKLSQMAKFAPFIFVNQKNVRGTQVTEWKTPQPGVMLAYGWLNNKSLLITLGAPFVEVMKAKSGTSLAQSNNFQTITKSLPKTNLGYFYLDVEKAMSVANNLPQARANSIPPEANAMLNSIQGIAVTATMPDKSTSQLDMVFSLEPQTSN